MQICPHCGKENARGDVYCYSCGHILPFALEAESGTSKLEDVYETMTPQRRWGTAFFDRQSAIELKIRDTGDTLSIGVNKNIVVGRFHDDPVYDQPDVDLGPFGAVEKGVSRVHIKIVREYDTLSVLDLNSSNSTFLNGQRLMPHEPRVLRDNDELRLGHMVIRIAFV